MSDMGQKSILAFDEDLYDEAAEVVRLASAAGVTLGCAESCTGGLVCGCLTAVPGSSSAVKGGVVSYAIPVKHELLGVPREGVLEAEGVGAVSPECAMAMAEGARRVLCCDASVSITGIAGPGGAEPGKPVGTVWFGGCGPKASFTRMFCFDGSREEVRRQACHVAIGILRELVEAAGRPMTPSL